MDAKELPRGCKESLHGCLNKMILLLSLIHKDVIIMIITIILQEFFMEMKTKEKFLLVPQIKVTYSYIYRLLHFLGGHHVRNQNLVHLND